MCPPFFATVIHLSVNLGTSILILALECAYEAIDTQDQRRSLVCSNSTPAAAQNKSEYERTNADRLLLPEFLN